MIGENLKTITCNIEKAKEKSGATHAVELLAASKTQPKERIEEAYALGIRVFGENRVQEFVDKYDSRYTWDFIGRLQTNKVKYVVGKVRLIHSVDRTALLEAIDKEARKKGLIQDILVEINGGEEADKGGVFPQNALEFVQEAVGYPNLRVRGIMAVMPKTEDETLLRGLYERLRGVRKEILLFNPSMTLFSAGMTNDYSVAVEYGANIIRLGRALFGERL